MRTRNRSHDSQDGAAGGEPSAPSAQPRLQAAARLAAEADAIIDRVLHHDSQRFLDATRQEGGQ